jgi:hypothetical protein
MNPDSPSRAKRGMGAAGGLALLFASVLAIVALAIAAIAFASKRGKSKK